jgi:hypothetical protein
MRGWGDTTDGEIGREDGHIEGKKKKIEQEEELTATW